ncbi:hypothetical protein FGKAn22_00040 [Ferrigenium kumadai]|uniref:Uncharacterized protein n=1 Tax=Ferrigenium kumadai TaxID=1682490 RepID=A0AAN1SXE7_9PROT|nr:hypothetical protein [Ferrigenium kumadai]BBI98311.1 hypothetical protein FGKAn22_00040 [Ferrigenium kumadai]
MNTDMTGMLWHDLDIFLLIGALSGVVLGLIMISRPQILPNINRVANRWISMRHVDRALDQSISIDYWFYRHHRPLGILVILGASYLLVYFGFLFDKESALHGLAGYVPITLLDGLLDALVLASLVGAMIALVVGLLLWLYPNLLHGVEKVGNRWVSSRRATKVLNVPHDQVDSFVEHHTRLTGWLLLLGSAYLFTAMISLLV